MKIEELTDLAKLIALCRKTGVQSIKVDNIEMHLGAEPVRKPSKRKAKSQQPTSNEPDVIETDELTYEQKLFYSAIPAQPEHS